MGKHRHGEFSGLVQAKWCTDGRKMVLQQDLTFTDSRDVPWEVPHGAMIDGASIPHIFWSFGLGPYEGRFRDGSVVHDYACCMQIRTSPEAHRMFYDAMRARGEKRWRAKLMYWAVVWFGPDWPQEPEKADFTEDDLARAWIFFQREEEISLDEVDQLDADALRRREPTPSHEFMARHRLISGRRVEPFEKLWPCHESDLPAGGCGKL